MVLSNRLMSGTRAAAPAVAESPPPLWPAVLAAGGLEVEVEVVEVEVEVEVESGLRGSAGAGDGDGDGVYAL